MRQTGGRANGGRKLQATKEEKNRKQKQGKNTKTSPSFLAIRGYF